MVAHDDEQLTAFNSRRLHHPPLFRAEDGALRSPSSGEGGSGEGGLLATRAELRMTILLWAFAFFLFWTKCSRMFYAYILESLSRPAQVYRGHTSNLKQRLADHNAGKCPHTTMYRPWKVKFYAAFDTLPLAQEFERYLKSGSGHAFAKRHLGI